MIVRVRRRSRCHILKEPRASAGPFAEYALMMMAMYPQLYADVGLLTWSPPPDVLEGFLREAKQRRKLDRITFRTDQMTWPEAIGIAVAHQRRNGRSEQYGTMMRTVPRRFLLVAPHRRPAEPTEVSCSLRL